MQYEIALTQLTELNEDCLRLIFSQLSIPEQFAVRRLSDRCADIVTGIWRSSHTRRKTTRTPTTVDCRRADFLGLLEPQQVALYLGIVGPSIEKIANLSVEQARKLFTSCSARLSFRRLAEMAAAGSQDLARSSSSPDQQLLELPASLGALLPALTTLRLRQLDVRVAELALLCRGPWRHLTALELINVGLADHEQQPLSRVLECLPELRDFALLPVRGAGGEETSQRRLADAIAKCRALRTLRLTAAQTAAIGAELAQLTALRTLTIFSRDAATTAGRAQLVDAVRATTTATATLTTAAVTLSCHFDRSLVRALQPLRHMRRFRWRLHLEVELEACGEGRELKWQAHDRQTTWALLGLLASLEHLEALDVRGNPHIGDEHLERIWQMARSQQERGRSLRVMLENEEEEEPETGTGIDAEAEGERDEALGGCGYLMFEFQ